MYRNALPQLSGEVFLTDSGLETDLIFNEGFDLPEFASFVLVDDARGRDALAVYFRRHADIAVQHGCGVILEAPTWRASRDWGVRIGYPAAELRRVNESAAALLSQVRSEYRDAAASSPVVVSGCIGPRADAYSPAERMGEDEAEDYHSEQIAILAATEVDLVHAMTITYTAEAIGIARAAAGAVSPPSSPLPPKLMAACPMAHLWPTRSPQWMLPPAVRQPTTGSTARTHPTSHQP
jgi:homocysteine S-methyltransferase